jgi:exonuclease VII small subunit
MSKETEKLKQEITELDLDRSNLFKIVDKLEQRIATLEKVLASHAKCIGEMREDKKDVA